MMPLRAGLIAALTLFIVTAAHADTTYDITTTSAIYGGDVSGTITGSGLMVDSFDITVSDGVSPFVFNSSTGSKDFVNYTGGTLSDADPVYQIELFDPNSDTLFLYFTGDFTDGLASVSNTTLIYVGGKPDPEAFVDGYQLQPTDPYSNGAGGNDSYAAVVPSAATPEPSSLILLGTGALGLAGAARRRFLNA